MAATTTTDASSPWTHVQFETSIVSAAMNFDCMDELERFDSLENRLTQTILHYRRSFPFRLAGNLLH